MKVRILGIDVEVKVSGRGEMGDGDWQGRADYIKSLIKISNSSDEDNKRKTFLHEILHYLNHEMDMGLKEDNIDRLETGLYAVIQDNPHIFEYKWKDKE